MLSVEALIRWVLTCRASKFFQILNQGRLQILRETDVFYFLKQQRENNVSFDLISSHNQRRLIKQQVKASMVISPFSAFSGAATLWDSDMEATSSDEDLDFLQDQLAETGTLTPETMKLVRGII